MPPRFGSQAPSQGAAQAPANAPQQPAPNRPQAPTHQPHGTSRTTGNATVARDRDDDGMEFKPGDDQDDGSGGGGGRWPRSDSFAPLHAGYYEFIMCVNSIVRWHFGAVVTLRVIHGPERGRDIDWNQSVGAQMSDKFKEVWRRIFFTAYAAGGWTVEPDQSRGWDGWEPSSKRGSDGKPLPVPPYDRFFVGEEMAGGVGVPCALVVGVRADEGYESRPKVTSVKLLRSADGRAVQAPAPFRVIEWIARRNGWRGAVDDKIAASGKTTQPTLRLDQKQVPKGACGLQWYTDALRDARGAMRNSNISPGADSDDIPF